MAPGSITKSPVRSASPELTSMGDAAAAAFACFDRGLAPDETLMELVLPVDTVEYLWRTWARLRGAVLISVEGRRALREALYVSGPIHNGKDAIAAVRRFAERPFRPCPRCKIEPREYCTTCPTLEATRAARVRSPAATKRRSVLNNPSRVSGVVESAPSRGSAASPCIQADDALMEPHPPHPKRGGGSA